MADATNVSQHQIDVTENAPKVTPEDIEAAYAGVARLEADARQAAQVTHHFGVSLDHADSKIVRKVNAEGVPYVEQHLGL